MKKIDIVRAWKDATYRDSLSDAERAALPANPAGSLSHDDLAAVTGGEEDSRPTHKFFTLACCRVTAGIFCGRYE